jgi:hypothetical protein
MNNPFTGMKISINNESKFSYLNSIGQKIDITERNEVTNYEYENDLNETYRKILLLKPQYLGVFIEDFKNIMTYDKTSETINSKLKRVSNPRITE